MNILLTLSFKGGAYHGFQVQKNAIGICAVLQDALEKVFGVRGNVKGCSRTDTGVHALEYCASVHVDTALPCHKIPMALNFHLPHDIRVKQAVQVPEKFHARYDAMEKQYRYVWLNARVDDPFSEGLYYRLAGPLDEAAMHKAAQSLVGKHDFASFMSAGSKIEDTHRTVRYLRVWREGERVLLEIAADGYLYNMVRIIAGTLMWVGRGKCSPSAVADILAATDRGAAGETIPAKGLFLQKVIYPLECLALDN